MAASEQCADLLYATRFFAPDPFLYLARERRVTLLLSDLEFDRGKAVARAGEILRESGWATPLQRELGRPPSQAEIAASLLRARRIGRVEVPYDFPAGAADILRAAGIRVVPVAGMFFPARTIKSAAELRAISAALRITETGIARGVEVLRAARAGRGRVLRWAGEALTSERLRGEIDAAVVRAGGIPQRTIVAGGSQACDPHEIGHGPLRMGELIILDVFPRSAATGYFGDLTRTVLKGRATEPQRRLWQTVRDGQRLALRSIRAGVSGGPIHERVKAFFAGRGFPTELREGRMVGFFHGTGHALGLEIHEAPRFARARLRAGHVFTVEPGLYYPEIGGVRIEDVVAVKPGGYRILSRCPPTFEID